MCNIYLYMHNIELFVRYNNLFVKTSDYSTSLLHDRSQLITRNTTILFYYSRKVSRKGFLFSCVHGMLAHLNISKYLFFTLKFGTS